MAFMDLRAAQPTMASLYGITNSVFQKRCTWRSTAFLSVHVIAGFVRDDQAHRSILSRARHCKQVILTSINLHVLTLVLQGNNLQMQQIPY